MEVDRDDAWRVPEEVQVLVDREAVVSVSQGVFQVAHVVRNDGRALAAGGLQQAKTVLQLSPQRQHRWRAGKASW